MRPTRSWTRWPTHRRAHGLPAMSLGWGLWEQPSAMTGQLDAADLSRLGRSGVLALSVEDALSLFDDAMVVNEPYLAAARIDRAALRARAADNTLPPMFTDLAGPTRRRVDDALARGAVEICSGATTAGLTPDEQQTMVLDLLRSHMATVLGPPSPMRSTPSWRSGPRIRLADRRRAAQPPQERHRADAVTDADLRLPDPAKLAAFIRSELVELPSAMSRCPPRPRRSASRRMRSRWWGCRVVIRGVWILRRGCGMWWLRVGM